MNQKPFALTSMERQSGLWKRLLEHMKAQRDVLREKNDNAMGEVQTAHIRGRIAQLTELTGLDTPAPGVDP